MKLINHVLDIRRLIQQAFDNRFSRMGLRVDGPIPHGEMPTDIQQKRQKLNDLMVNHLQELNEDYSLARQAAINECVFTLFNRIAAIKVMEAKELFPEIIRRRKENAGRSFEHNAWLEEHPEERNAEREGLKHFLSDQFDKLGEHIPLYKSDYPYALMPTADELFEIIEQFNAVEEDSDCGEDVWKGDDILGWLYENFNAVEKEALKASGEKTEYNRVSLQSQVYTPAWVVKFLVDNTLGKSYLEMYPDSTIKEKYKIANAPSRQVKHPKDLREMRLLDPACGSGNFLIYAFSLFYDLYMDQMENYGKDYSRRNIPKMIVENNLYGMDLDERAAQISQIALFIKARELGGHRSHWPEYTNVISTHFYLPSYEKVKEDFGYNIQSREFRDFEDVAHKAWDDLASAYKFGSLIRIKEVLDAMLPNDENHLLFSTEQMGELFSFHNVIKESIHKLVEIWGCSNDFTMTKSSEARSFLNMIYQKYDVVVANPPYTDSGDFGKELKEFVDNNYKEPYKFSNNLYACFINRCCELADDEGKVGMIHPHTFMFIKTFEDVRRYLLDYTHINVMVDYGLDRVNLFGPGILLDATFYTLDMNKQENTDGVYFNITANQQEKYKKGSLAQAYEDFLNGTPNDRVYTLPQSKLKGIKSWPFIYWISDEFREKLSCNLLEDVLRPAQGIATTNNNRYLRFWWEVYNDKHSLPEQGCNWMTYSKGGPYLKWYGNLWLTCLWKDDGADLKASKAVLRNPSYYFKEGITYSAVGSKGVSFRYLPTNCLFDSKGPGIYPDKYKNVFYSLAVLNAKLTFYICDCLDPTVSINQGDIDRIPWVVPNGDIESVLSDYAKQNVTIRQKTLQTSLTEISYAGSPISHDSDAKRAIIKFYNTENALLTQILLNESIINKTVFEIYELSEKDKQMVLDKEGIPVGDLPVSPEAKTAYKKWLQGNTEVLASEEVLQHLDKLEERNDLAKVTDFETLYTNNKEWEEFCIQHNINPVEVWYQFKNANILPPQRTQVLAFELLTDVIRSVLAKDDDGVIPLGDKMGEERLAIRIEREFMERGYSTAQFNQVCQLLGCDLEKYLQERFFQQLSDHLNLFMYLPKTPFIWHLSSGEHHAMELYISIYKWNRDTLFRIRSIYAANREAAIRDRLNSIDTSKTEGRLEATELRAMLEELNSFCQKIDDLLASGYDPKLDDGVGKNIAPLQKRKMISYEVLNAGQLKKYLNADW